MRAYKAGVAKRKTVRVAQSAADTDAPIRWQWRDVGSEPNTALLLYTMDIRKTQAAMANTAIVTASWNPYVFDVLNNTYPQDGWATVETHWSQNVTQSTAVGINSTVVMGDSLERFDFAQSPNTPLLLVGDRVEFGLSTTLTGLSNGCAFVFEYELVTVDTVMIARLMSERFG